MFTCKEILGLTCLRKDILALTRLLKDISGLACLRKDISALARLLEDNFPTCHHIPNVKFQSLTDLEKG